MLQRVEIVFGLVAIALITILAGYAMVSVILIARPSAEVRACVTRAKEDAAENHKRISRGFATEMCERLMDGPSVIALPGR
jgi:hypothetical protein